MIDEEVEQEINLYAEHLYRNRGNLCYSSAISAKRIIYLCISFPRCYLPRDILLREETDAWTETDTATFTARWDATLAVGNLVERGASARSFTDVDLQPASATR